MEEESEVRVSLRTAADLSLSADWKLKTVTHININTLKEQHITVGILDQFVLGKET